MPISLFLRLMVAPELLLDGLREVEHLERLKCRLQADANIAKRMLRCVAPCRRIEISRARYYASGLLVEEIDCCCKCALSFS